MISTDTQEVARVVAAALLRPDFRHEMRRLSDAEGAHPIVIAAADEPCREAFQRVRDAGGTAHIATLVNSELIVMGCVLGREPGPTEAELDDCPVHRNSSLGMLVTYLLTTKSPVVCHEVREDLKVELVASAPAD